MYLKFVITKTKVSGTLSSTGTCNKPYCEKVYKVHALRPANYNGWKNLLVFNPQA